MKKIVRITLFAAALLAAACTRKTADIDVPDSGLKPGEFSATAVATKVTINGEWALEWEADDPVAIWDGAEKKAYKAAAAGATTTLTPDGEGFSIADETTYYAVFPAADDVVFSGTSVSLKVDTDRSASAGVYPSAPAVASTTGSAKSFTFNNICGLVSFNISDSNIASIVIFGASDENVAGTITVDASTGAVSSITSGEKSILLTPDSGTAFDTGRYYVALLPGTYSGLCVTLYKTDGSRIRKNINGFTLGQSHHVDVATTGTYKTNFTIKDGKELAAFLAVADQLSSTDVVTLANDIDMSGVTVPSAAGFAGTFDGNGKTLTNLALTGPIFTTLSGTVKDLTVGSGSSLTFSHVAGSYGFIAGTNSGTISQVTISGSVAADTDQFETPTASTSVDMCVGAICGTNSGTVTGCTNNANFAIISDISKYTPTYLGGIVGQQANTTALTTCTNNGTVSLNNPDRSGLHISASCFVGGIVGGTKYGETVGAALTGCANSGNVEVVARDGSSSSPEIKLGGIAGYLDGTLDDCDNSGAISNSIPTETTAGNSLRNCTIAGVAGTVTGAISGCDNTGNVTASGSYCYSTAGTETQTFFGGVAGYAGSTVSSCTNTKPLTITAMMNSTSTSATHNGYFGGIAGYVVSTIDGCTNSGALGIQSTFCTGWVGGIAGYTLETIGATTLCSNSGDISYDFVNTEASGNQAKNAYIGGISGQHAGTDKTIKGDASVSSGKITVNNGFYNASNITYVGGITGHCTGAINGTAVSAAGRATYSGTITVNSELLVRVGGIVGETSKTLLNVCYSGKISIPDLGTKSCVGGFTGVKSGSVNMGGSTLTGTVTCTYAGEKNTTNNVRVGLCHGIVTGKMTTHSTTIGAAAKLTATGGMYAGIFAGSASVALTMGTSTNAFTYRPGVTFNSTSVATVDDLTDGFLVGRLYSSGAITRTNLKVE